MNQKYLHVYAQVQLMQPHALVIFTITPLSWPTQKIIFDKISQRAHHTTHHKHFCSWFSEPLTKQLKQYCMVILSVKTVDLHPCCKQPGVWFLVCVCLVTFSCVTHDVCQIVRKYALPNVDSGKCSPFHRYTWVCRSHVSIF